MPKIQGTCIVEGCSNKQAPRGGGGGYRAVCKSCQKKKKSPHKNKARDPNSNASKKRQAWREGRPQDEIRRETRYLTNSGSYRGWIKANE